MKENQSLIDFFQTAPLSSFLIRRSPISNKEAQILYDVWSSGNKDEYGKHIVPLESDPITIASLTSKGYVKNQLSRYSRDNSATVRTLEFTKKGKDVIQKIILYKERSAFEKSSEQIDYESICMAEAFKKDTKEAKTASSKPNQNWLQKLCW
jgi:hypothetical protein